MTTARLGGLLTAFSLSLGLVSGASAHGGDATKIHACVNNASGEVKIVGPSSTCHHNSTAVDWNVTGPQGPAGSQGPAGPGTTQLLPPNRSAGRDHQFLTVNSEDCIDRVAP